MHQKRHNTCGKNFLMYCFKYNNALGCKKIFQALPFYNSFIKKPKIKKLSSVELLKELTFYDELKIAKSKTAFSGCARSYKIEIVDKRDVIIQLKASELSIEELFKELLNELKGFKYQINLAILLSKTKTNVKLNILLFILTQQLKQ